jgi:Rrf2 family protein
MNLLRISEAASLGLHTMALLARHRGQRFTTEEIATQLHASEHHLAKVMRRLARAGMVEAVRGPQGGFCLLRAPSRVKLVEIFEAIEGPLGSPTCLLSGPGCDGRKHCVLGNVVQQVHGIVRDYLTRTSLEDLALGAAFLQIQQ